MTKSQTRNGASHPRSGVAQSERTGPTSSTSDRAKAHSAGSAARLLSGGGAMRRSPRATVERSGPHVANRACCSAVRYAPLLHARMTALLSIWAWVEICLLYTSDAADERSSVDLGGR